MATPGTTLNQYKISGKRLVLPVPTGPAGPARPPPTLLQPPAPLLVLPRGLCTTPPVAWVLWVAASASSATPSKSAPRHTTRDTRGTPTLESKPTFDLSPRYILTLVTPRTASFIVLRLLPNSAIVA